MNKHIYNTLFKIQERESDRRSKEIEQTKESQNIHTQTKQQGHVILSTEQLRIFFWYIQFDNNNINITQIAAIALATAIDYAPTFMGGAAYI